MPVDLSANEPATSGMDAEYSAAFEAADAVFGGKVVEVAALQEPSDVPTSRVLPCLLQREAQLSSLAEEAKKAGRAPRALKPLGRKAAKAKALHPPIKAAIAKKVIEPSPIV